MSQRHQLPDGADPVLRAAVEHAKERRAIWSVDAVELRAADASMALRGYASVFNHPYDVAGMFTEVIEPGAFKRTISQRGNKIHLLALHDGLPLASTQAGTMTLAEDDHGLAMEARLDQGSPYAQSVFSTIQRGDLDEMSIGFWVLKDAWDWEPEIPVRTISEIKLAEVSVVPRGANDATEVDVARTGFMSLTTANTTANTMYAAGQDWTGQYVTLGGTAVPERELVSRNEHPGAIEATRLLAAHFARR